MRTLVYSLIYVAGFLFSLPIFCQQDTTIANIYYDRSTSYLQTGRLDSMSHYLALAAPIYHEHHLYVKEAHCYNRMGYASNVYGQNRQSAILYKKAIALYERELGPVNSYPLGAKANLSYIFQEAGQLDSALAINLDCIALSKNSPDIKPEFLVNFHYNAGVFSKDLGLFFAADSLLRLSEQIALDRLPENHPGLISPYMGFGSLYLTTGLIEEASKYYEKALHLQQFHQRFDSETGSILHNLAQSYTHQGRQEKAKVYFEQAINLHKQMGLNKAEIHAKTLIGYASTLLYNEKSDEAIPYLEEAYNILDQLQGNFFESQLYCESFSGLAYSQLGQYELAEHWLDKARKSLEEFHRKHSFGYYQDYYYCLYRHLSTIGQTEVALQVIEDGLQRMMPSQKHHPINSSELQLYKADLLAKQQKWLEAQETIELGLSYVLPSWSPGESLEKVHERMIPSRYYAMRILSVKAQIEQSAWKHTKEPKYLKKWLTTSRHGCRLLKQSIQGYAHPEEKQQLIHTVYGLLDLAIAACWEAYQLSPDRAHLDLLWELMEDAKAIVLTQTIQKMEQQQLVRIPSSLLEEEQRLKRTVSFTRSKISHFQSKEMDSQESFRLERELLSHQLAYEQWFEKIQQNYPEYTDLRYGTRTTSLTKLQEQLPVNTCLIEFSFVEGRLICLRIDRDSVRAFALHDQQDTLYESIDALLLSSQQQHHAFIDHAYLLYQILLEPVLDGSSYDKLILIPDGKLNEIPFELLLTEAGLLPIAYPSLSYLIKDYAITYNYSGHFWATNSLFHRSSQAKQSLLAMAPMGPENQTNSPNLLASVVERAGLSPLPNSIQEIQAVQEIIGGKALANSEATEALFHQESGQSRILHLATHSVINNQDPLMSYLLLSPSSDSIPEEDGYLHAHELYNLQLKAELVTLSACNTGVGTIRDGEGVVCLARGFAYAGCPNLVMSLWAVPDAATSELMTSFYKGLDQGLEKDDALRQAKIAYIQNSPPERTAPYYWGAWVLVGDQKPLTNASLSWFWLGGIILLIAGGIFASWTLIQGRGK
ncbi:MAG: CHAT domain-containing tetratricopeptide repeat protein [Bacteroidota bacterium]